MQKVHTVVYATLIILYKIFYKIVRLTSIIYELPLFQICVLFTGYTVEQVDSLEAYTDKDGGHVQKLYRDLQTRYNFTLCQLVDALQNIERLDILDELSHIEEFKHLEWSKRMTPESSFENQILQPSIDNQIKTALPQNIRLIKRDENKSDCTYQKAECKVMFQTEKFRTRNYVHLTMKVILRVQ